MFMGGVVVSAQEQHYSVTAFGTFTTSSKLFYHPNDIDEFTRGQFFPLDNIFSVGIEVRMNIPALRTQLGLSVEYISKSELINVPLSSVTIPLEDGFRAFPTELTGYFMIPFGGEHIQMFMGGGVGVYPGIRTYDYAGAKAVPVEHSIGAGIHVVSGIEYVLNKQFSLRSTFKFRDVQFESVNRFTKATTTYNGTAVTLSSEALPSRINIDGMVVTVGIAVHF